MTLVSQFKESLESIGGIVRVADSEHSLIRSLQEIAADEQAKTLMIWDRPELRKAAGKAFSGSDYIVYINHKHQSKDELIEDAKKADIGITWGDVGIAETGSIALISGEGKARSVSLIPRIHVAVLPSASLVAKRAEAFRILASGMAKTRNVTLISGPSRTGDIDGKLYVGVHGPVKMYALIADYEA